MDVDLVVIGGGVVGLACAAEGAKSGYSTLLVERHESFGNETSSRNSEVVHSGIYYPTGSLKATLCVAGNAGMYEECERLGVWVNRCGKLVVAVTEAVQQGGWLKIQGTSLHGKTLGIIGLGDIGKAVARRAHGFGMKLIGYDVRPCSPDPSLPTIIIAGDLDEVLRGADFVALCCNLTPSNHHMLSFSQFELMKQGVYLVNTSRGPLVDERALVKGLHEGKVAGAALDVFEVEPLPAGSPLRTFKRCIFGTHNSSNTIEAVLRVNELAIQNLFTGLG